MKIPATKSLRLCARHLAIRRTGKTFACSLLLTATSLFSIHSVQAAGNDAWALTPANGSFMGNNWTTGTTTPGAATGTAATGDALYFGTSSVTSLTNDDTGFSFASLTFNAGASAFTIGGNSFSLTGGITASSTSTQTINAPFTIANTATFSTTSGGSFLVLGGNISATAGTGGQISTGTNGGTLFLNGNNTFAGISTTFNALTATVGLILNANTTVVLGSNTGAGTGAIQFNTGTLAAASSGVTIANGITTNNANGTFGSGGDIKVNGVFQFAGGNTITVNNNTTLAGGVDIRDNTGAAAVRTVNFNGTGNLTISGAVINGSNGGAGTLFYSGLGAMTLSGANTYTGGTQLYSGTTNLDYSTNPGLKISGGGTGGALILGGSTLNLSAGTASLTEVVASTTLASGASSINETNSGASNINLGAITRNTGSTLSVNTGGVVLTPTSTSGANNVMTTFAGVVGVVGGNDWAAKDSANARIVGFSTVGTYATVNSTTGFTAGTNADVTSSVTLAAAAAPNTVRFNAANATTVDQGGFALNLGASGILVTSAVGNNLTTITNGTLTGVANATAGVSGLFVFQNNTFNGLTIASTIANNGTGAQAYVQGGPGLVTLSNTTNTYTGATYLNGGTTNIAADQSLGAVPAAAANQLVMNGGTVQFGANNIALAANRGIGILGNGATFDTNGTTGSTINGVVANIATTTGSTTINTGRFVKAGAGTLTLAAQNTYTVPTVITGGTLSLARAGAALSATAGGTLAGTSVAVNTGGTLSLGANYTMATNSLVTLGGGTFSVANGVSQGTGATVSGGTVTGTPATGLGMLTLTSNSSLTFAGASGVVVFSSFDPTNLATGNFTLQVSGSTFGTTSTSADTTNDRLIFNQQLSAAQLADIQFLTNGTTYSATERQLSGTFYEILPGAAVAVPEPSTWVSGLLMAGAGIYGLRRRLAARRA